MQEYKIQYRRKHPRAHVQEWRTERVMSATLQHHTHQIRKKHYHIDAFCNHRQPSARRRQQRPQPKIDIDRRTNYQRHKHYQYREHRFHFFT